MKQEVIAAFLEVRGGSSPDAAIADKEMNHRFLESCRRKGVAASDEASNRCLLNLRKAGDLRGLKSRPVVVKNQDSFRFASEAAIRFLERRDNVTLDTVLCDPMRALEFDKIAAEVCPGFTSFEYRWAALALRKTRKLAPELVAKVLPALVTLRYRIEGLDIESIPDQQGIYLFHDSRGVLYIGEAASLYKRAKKHLDHSDNKGLARWLWQHGAEDLHLEIQVLPANTEVRVRKALEAELINSRRPLFNVAGVRPS